MFCSQCGQPMTAADSFCGRCGARATAGDVRAPVLQAIATALSPMPQLELIWGKNADLEISNELANANWGTGKKKIEYSACLRLNPGSQTVFFWEMIKASGRGLMALFSFKAEMYRTDGTTRSGTVREKAYGPGGKVIDYDWDYGQVRQIVEAAVKTQGWRFETVLLKGKASY